MDWRSRTDTGARPSDESNLVETANVFLFSIPCYAMRIICACVYCMLDTQITIDITNDSTCHAFYMASSEFLIPSSFFFIFVFGLFRIYLLLPNDNHPTAVACLFVIANPVRTHKILLVSFSSCACVCVDGTFFCILKSCL
jgi:hypothetical protein